MATNGYEHFKNFNEKLNVLCELISNTDQNAIVSKIFETGDSKAKIDEIIQKKHITVDLINNTFTFDNTLSNSSFITELKVNSRKDPITIKISQGVKQSGNKAIDDLFKNTWFDKNRFELFKVSTEDNTNIVALNSSKNYTELIEKLFVNEDNKHVWETTNDMLALFNRPVLLLTFDMYYYNFNKKQLFQNNFEVDTGTTQETNFNVYSLLHMDKFDLNKRPSFLMLLMYYAGYSFNIEKQKIIEKFENKFYSGTSFEIKLYTPIDNKIETTYNNLLKSTIKPTTVDLDVETLEVYHVGGKINSLWDYVNGKLTILINNMLSSGTDKDRYKTILKREYTSNSLFLFDCIRELQKYKEYILNPLNITTIAYPMSTLKTIEILILKLSYILSVLEPTFIPIETMSFDVIMDGKKLKYVINSELQATNISIEDHISNDTLMTAILSTRELLFDLSVNKVTKEKSLALISTNKANSIYSKKFTKDVTYYENMEARKHVENEKLSKELGLYETRRAKRADSLNKMGKDKESDPEYKGYEESFLDYDLALARSTFRLANVKKKKAAAQVIIDEISRNTLSITNVVNTYNAIKVPDSENEEADGPVINAKAALVKFNRVRATKVVGGSSKNTTKKVNRK